MNEAGFPCPDSQLSLRKGPERQKSDTLTKGMIIKNLTYTFLHILIFLVRATGCPPECGQELIMAVHFCSNSPVEDEESFIQCVESYFSAECHDCLCEAMADEGYPCSLPR